MEMVNSFRYLAQVISPSDDDWPAVVRNLSQARALWKRMTRILSREGAEPQVSGLFFKSVVQEVLLFGLGTYVVTPRMGRSLGGFQYQVARRMAGRLPRRKPDRKWTYTSAATSREDSRFQTMEEYILRRNNMVAPYIDTRSLLDMSEGSERAPGVRLGMQWWEQAGINLAGARKVEEVEKYVAE